LIRGWPLAALILLLAACAKTPTTAGPAPGPTEGPIRILAKSLSLNPKNPAQDRVGDFVFAGGLQLSSPDTSLLGGFSDIKVDRTGNLVSESDEGSLLHAHIVLDAMGRLVGLDHATIVRLKGEGGQVLPDKAEADAEGVALWPNGDLMISFERDHRIWIYPAAGGAPRVAPRPTESMPANAGMEGLALAPSRGVDAYWVGVENGDIFLCHLATDCQQVVDYPYPPSGWRLPALGETPAGEFVLMHTTWDPFLGNRIALSIWPKTPVKGGRPIDTLSLARPLTVDNFEGVAVVPGPRGGDRFYMISDDNFSDRQRTLLLAFDRVPAVSAKP
jgi:hypothetical protein